MTVQEITKKVGDGKKYLQDHVEEVHFRVVPMRTASKKQMVGRTVAYDLFAGYCFQIPADGGIASITLCQNLNVGEEVLYEYAMKNLEKEFASFPLDSSFLFEEAAEMAEDFEMEEDFEGLSMTVFTNRMKVQGANQILNTRRLKEYADEVQDDVLIIPSSVHEIILLPAAALDVDYVNTMILEVNNTVLMPGDYLSNHAYVFNRAIEKVGIAIA